jgi:Response regulators consisting of a CheY-like receiver domain and a winged-helix DNA-binding domain
MEIKDTILIIDDEVQIRRLLEITLSANGYSIAEATNAKDGMVAAASHTPALIILDLGLPDMDGQLVLKKLREWYLKPIIILSARSAEDDIVAALDAGANDYLTKPFRNNELLARIRSCIRFSAAKEVSPVIKIGSLAIDLSSHTVKKNGELLKLTSTEFNLLSLLAKNVGKVLTHQQILKEVWGHGYISQNQYLRVFVGQLRKKVEDDPAHPTLIKTESGIGYRFADEV